MDELKLPTDPELAKKVLDNNAETSKQDRELGFLGKFFGSGTSGNTNIVGLLIVLLLLTGITCTFLLLSEAPATRGISILELWGIITPLLTLALGFLFGKAGK